MPLASALPDMDAALGAINANMSADGDAGHAGEQWSMIAEAFFINGDNPKWTTVGIEAGKAAFAGAFGATIVADPVAASFKTALSEGFKAFADLAAIPANAAPVSPPGQIPPIVPPTTPPSPISEPPASDSHSPMAGEIFAKVSAWAPSGLVSVPNPAGVGPPVPTTPWA